MRKADEYAEGLTIHGLSKALKGSTIAERMFWTIALMLAIVMAGFMVQTLILRFYNHDVYTDSSSIKTERHIFPAVTFCNRGFTKNAFCGILRHGFVSQESFDVCPKEIALEDIKSGLTLNDSLRKWTVMQQLNKTTTTIFSIGCAEGMDCTPLYISEEYFKVTEESPGDCVTWNFNGTFHNMKSKIEFSVTMKGQTGKGDIAIYIHDPKESPLTMNYFIPSNINQNLDLIFHKIVEEKMNRPPPNDCIEGGSDKDMFPGKYTITGCLDTSMCKIIYRGCGATFDFCAKYIPNQMVDQYQSINKTNFELYECIKGGFYSGRFRINPSLCPPPCKKTKIRTLSSSYVKFNTTQLGFNLRMLYQERNSYELNVEKEVFTWQDLVSGVGGMIGLFCGFSLLSLLELAVFAGLKVFGKQKK